MGNAMVSNTDCERCGLDAQVKGTVVTCGPVTGEVREHESGYLCRSCAAKAMSGVSDNPRIGLNITVV